MNKKSAMLLLAILWMQSLALAKTEIETGDNSTVIANGSKASFKKTEYNITLAITKNHTETNNLILNNNNQTTTNITNITNIIQKISEAERKKITGATEHISILIKEQENLIKKHNLLVKDITEKTPLPSEIEEALRTEEKILQKQKEIDSATTKLKSTLEEISDPSLALILQQMIDISAQIRKKSGETNDKIFELQKNLMDELRTIESITSKSLEISKTSQEILAKMTDDMATQSVTTKTIKDILKSTSISLRFSTQQSIQASILLNRGDHLENWDLYLYAMYSTTTNTTQTSSVVSSSQSQVINTHQATSFGLGTRYFFIDSLYAELSGSIDIKSKKPREATAGIGIEFDLPGKAKIGIDVNRQMTFNNPKTTYHTNPWGDATETSQPVTNGKFGLGLRIIW